MNNSHALTMAKVAVMRKNSHRIYLIQFNIILYKRQFQQTVVIMFILSLLYRETCFSLYLFQCANRVM